MTYSTPTLLILGFIGWILGSIPAFVVGSRTGVRSPAVAFIPGFGPYIVLLQSIRRTGWLCLLILVPVVNLVFLLWLVFTIPAEHGRTRLWGLFFILPLVSVFAIYAYAFSLDQYSRRSGTSSGGFGSTYHVPPGGDWRP